MCHTKKSHFDFYTQVSDKTSFTKKDHLWITVGNNIQMIRYDYYINRYYLVYLDYHGRNIGMYNPRTVYCIK